MTIGSHMKARISGMLSTFLQPSERRARWRLGHEGPRREGGQEAPAARGPRRSKRHASEQARGEPKAGYPRERRAAGLGDLLGSVGNVLPERDGALLQARLQHHSFL